MGRAEEMIMPNKCKECLEGINKTHLKNLKLEEEKTELRIAQEILGICDRGNARQNQMAKFFEIRRKCKEVIKRLRRLNG
jgi:hypothetical protein